MTEIQFCRKQLPANQDEELEQSPAPHQRMCLTHLLQVRKAEVEEEMKAKLSPEDFRVWRIQRDEPYHQLSLETWGTPLPPELLLKRI